MPREPHQPAGGCKEGTNVNRYLEVMSERRCFKCSVCTVHLPFDHFGRRPPYAPAFTFLEDAYSIKDPFSNSKANALVCVGSKCGSCKLDVCIAAKCSIFYSVRLCARCILDKKCGIKERLPKELGSQIGALELKPG